MTSPIKRSTINELERSAMIVKCPHCGLEEDAPEEYVGETAICDSCQGEYVVGGVAVPSSAFDKEGNATIECPYCLAQNSIKREYANRNVRCCECNGKFHIQVQMQETYALEQRLNVSKGLSRLPTNSHPLQGSTEHAQLSPTKKHIQSNANATMVICPHCGNATELTEENAGHLINCVCGQRFAVGIARAQSPSLKNSGKQEIRENNNSDAISCLIVLLRITLIPLIIFVCLCLCFYREFFIDKYNAYISDVKDKNDYAEYKNDAEVYDKWLVYNGFSENYFSNYSTQGYSEQYSLCLNGRGGDTFNIAQHSGKYWGPISWAPGDVAEILELRKRIYKYQLEHGLPNNNWIKASREQ